MNINRFKILFYFFITIFFVAGLSGQDKVEVIIKVKDSRNGDWINGAQVKYYRIDKLETDGILPFGTTNRRGTAKKNLEAGWTYEFIVFVEGMIDGRTKIESAFYPKEKNVSTVYLRTSKTTVKGIILDNKEKVPLKGALIIIENEFGDRIERHTNANGIFSIGTNLDQSIQSTITIQKGTEYESLVFRDRSFGPNGVLDLESIYLLKVKDKDKILINGSIKTIDFVMEDYVKKSIPIRIRNLRTNQDILVDPEEGTFRESISLKEEDSISISIIENPFYELSYPIKVYTLKDVIGGVIKVPIILKEKKKYLGIHYIRKDKFKDEDFPKLKASELKRDFPSLLMSYDSNSISINKGYSVSNPIPKKIIFELKQPLDKKWYNLIKHDFIFEKKRRKGHHVDLKLQKNYIINQKKWLLTTVLIGANVGLHYNKKRNLKKAEQAIRNGFYLDKAEKSRVWSNRFLGLAAASVVVNIWPLKRIHIIRKFKFD